MATEVPEELVKLFIEIENGAVDAGAISFADAMEACLAAVLPKVRTDERAKAAEEIMGRAEEYRGSLTGPPGSFRRGLEAAARHILPPITPEQLAGAIADGTAVVMHCPSLDEEGQ